MPSDIPTIPRLGRAQNLQSYQRDMQTLIDNTQLIHDRLILIHFRAVSVSYSNYFFSYPCSNNL